MLDQFYLIRREQKAALTGEEKKQKEHVERTAQEMASFAGKLLNTIKQ